MSATASPGRAAGEGLVNPWSADAQTDAETRRIMANPAFVELRRKRSSFGWLLTALMLVIYYGFVALVAFVPSAIGIKALGSLTTGLLLGIGVILSAIVLTGIYVLRANSEFDRLQAQVVRDAGGAR